MKKRISSLALSFALLAGTLPARAGNEFGEKEIKHVLLISVDGLHALDVARFIHSHPESALAELASHGITYSNARTPANSDSFPGLLALVTGGSPISHGLFYDVSYDRTYFDPTNTTCAGAAGNNMVFDESIDLTPALTFRWTSSIQLSYLSASMSKGAACRCFLTMRYGPTPSLK